MSESLFQFFGEHPFWAVFIAVFMILPMIGAVLHIVLKALGRRGIDNSLPGRSMAALTGGSETGEDTGPEESEGRQSDNNPKDPGFLRPGSGD